MEKLDNKKFTFVQAPFMAFFNGGLYQDVSENWKGSGALYIFLLSSAAWVISCVATFALPMMEVMNNKDFAGFIQQIPKMVIADGKLSIDRPSPYEMKDPKTGSAIIRFALDRKTDELVQGDPPIVITADQVLMRTDAAKYQTASNSDDEAAKPVFKFADISKAFPAKIELDSETIKQSLTQFFIIAPIAVLFVCWPFIFLGHLLQLLIFGGIGMLVANGMNKEMTFEKSMRLAAIAITPAVVISVGLTLLRSLVPTLGAMLGFWGFASIAVSMAYLIMVMRALPGTDNIQPTISR
jgi:hypothetical protein